MSEKKKFLLRLDGDLYAALEKWAADDLRSVNGQIEFLLRHLLQKAGRLNVADRRAHGDSPSQKKKGTPE